MSKQARENISTLRWDKLQKRSHEKKDLKLERPEPSLL